MSKVVVIGAGVIGLTNAYLLSQKGYDVTIIAKHIPGDFNFGFDYPSVIAGANWSSHCSKDDLVVQEIDKVAYKRFYNLAENVPGSSIVLRKAKKFVTKDAFKYKQNNQVILPWFSNFVKGFKMLPKSEVPEDCEYGFEFNSFVISTTVYLNWLLQQCFNYGVDLKRVTLNDINDAFNLHSSGVRADAVVNASGLLSKDLVKNEDKIFAVRGQVMLVENNTKDMFSVNFYDKDHPNESLYIMPRREGGCVIGGCFLPNEKVTAEVDYEQADRILNKAKKYVPDLVSSDNGNPQEFKIVRYQVGYRPFRKGGYRIEKDEENGKIIHCYGHGGAGYQSSWGSAELSVALVDSVLSKSKL
ncbi:nucleotide binding protein [[Candida] boidinii]|nr:nucleotide binding protein [[Candida] boidinii]